MKTGVVREADAYSIGRRLAPKRGAGICSSSPGVVAIYSGEDLAHFRTPPPMVKAPGRGGTALKVPERPTLARGRVH